jgi:hypothetical protein
VTTPFFHVKARGNSNGGSQSSQLKFFGVQAQNFTISAIDHSHQLQQLLPVATTGTNPWHHTKVTHQNCACRKRNFNFGGKIPTNFFCPSSS